MLEALLPADHAARGHRVWTHGELTLELAPNSWAGVLVAVEGTDGSGKTTLVRALAQRGRAASIPTTTTRLPTPAMRRSRLFRLVAREGRIDRADPVAMQVMHMADRLQHQFEVVLPALRAGHVVIADRYLLATLAAMARYGDTDIDWLRGLSRRIVRPDVWLLLHTPAAVAAARIRARAGEHDVVLDAEAFDAGNRFGLEIAQANSVRCIDTGAHALASYLGPLFEDVTGLVAAHTQHA